MSTSLERPTKATGGGVPAGGVGLGYETARPWSLWALAALGLVGLLRLVVATGRPFTSIGDVSFIELQIRQATHFGAAFGPYSRFGWHEPGPAMFYLYAPLYWLTGGSSRSLFASTWLLNMGSALAAVAVLRRQAGESVARVAAGAVGLYVFSVGLRWVIDPWNPSVLALPVLLFCVAAVAGGTGWLPGLSIAALTATFLVQTHISTAPLALPLLVVAAGGYLWHRRRGRTPSLLRHELILTAALASVVAVGWLPPLVQQATSDTGNLAAIARFEIRPPASAGPRTHSLDEAFAIVSDDASYVPLGYEVDVAGHRGRLLLAFAYAAAGLLTALWWRRRSAFMAALAATTPGGLLLGVLAATRVTGPIHGYMFWWARALPLPVLIAATAAASVATGAARLSARPHRSHSAGRRTAPDREAGVARVAGLMAVPLLLALHTAWVQPSASFPDQPGARALAGETRAQLGPDQTVTLRIMESSAEDAAYLVALAKEGVRYRLVPPLDLYEGDSAGRLGGPVILLGAGTPSRLAGRAVGTDGVLSVALAPPGA